MDELVKIQATPVDFTRSFWVFLVSKITSSVVLNSKKTEVNLIIILNTEFQPSMVTLEYICSHGKEKKKPAKFSKLAGKRASIRNNSF